MTATMCKMINNSAADCTISHKFDTIVRAVASWHPICTDFKSSGQRSMSQRKNVRSAVVKLWHFFRQYGRWIYGRCHTFDRKTGNSSLCAWYMHAHYTFCQKTTESDWRHVVRPQDAMHPQLQTGDLLNLLIRNVFVYTSPATEGVWGIKRFCHPSFVSCF